MNEVTGLTQETLDKAFEQLWHKVGPAEPSFEMAQEMAVANWLETQPPGTASRLLDEAARRQREQ